MYLKYKGVLTSLTKVKEIISLDIAVIVWCGCWVVWKNKHSGSNWTFVVIPVNPILRGAGKITSPCKLLFISRNVYGEMTWYFMNFNIFLLWLKCNFIFVFNILKVSRKF